jgi:DNA-binding transcriptional ArsR family regulator
MVAAAKLVEVAALVGDTARATMLAALMDGRSLTASELAYLAHVSRSTASEHLGKLVDARLLAVTSKRRFRYYRIASPLVARMLESIKAVAAIEMPPRHAPRSARDDALRFARTCYDHIAGSRSPTRWSRTGRWCLPTTAVKLQRQAGACSPASVQT